MVLTWHLLHRRQGTTSSPALIGQPPEVGIGDPGPGCADQIRLALGDGPLAGVQIGEATTVSTVSRAPDSLDGGGVASARGLLQAVVDRVVGVRSGARSCMMSIALAHLGKLDDVLKGWCRRAPDPHRRPASRSGSPRRRCPGPPCRPSGELGPVFNGAAELVIPGVGHGGEEFGPPAAPDRRSGWNTCQSPSAGRVWPAWRSPPPQPASPPG